MNVDLSALFAGKTHIRLRLSS